MNQANQSDGNTQTFIDNLTISSNPASQEENEEMQTETVR